MSYFNQYPNQKNVFNDIYADRYIGKILLNCSQSLYRLSNIELAKNVKRTIDMTILNYHIYNYKQ